MELKGYQKEVIKDIADFIAQVEKHNHLGIAFNEFWGEKGVSINDVNNYYLHPYDNSVKGVPRITAKVPTAGGKTFIACNALRTIFDSIPSEKPKVVAWFVPSDTILKQTYRNLSNPNHPYRQKIDSHFNGRVCVVDKETALSGTGISPVHIREQLTIFVLSVQSFAANNKEGRKSYRENENLAEYAKLYDTMTKRVEGADETALIQVLAYLNPVVIIDESHNFEAKLRVDMLNAINPSFILDLTATPREKSNIVSFVDAIKLKRANMVKLPVVVYNHRSKSDVIIKAITLQRSLEQKAIEQEKNGGKYIRPIVLFQAEPRTKGDAVDYDKIKQELVAIGIPEEQIKIKTADKNEIERVDLLSRDCPVRFIITVNALKEGWDCPFAYILASLANKSSRVDVEQILGRVLRLPYTSKHNHELLNMSYVFTASDNFRGTIENIIESLNKAGFSKRDYRVAESQEPKMVESPLANGFGLGGLFGGDDANDEVGNGVDTTSNEISQGDDDINTSYIKEQLNTPYTTNEEEHMEQIASDVNATYEAEMEEAEKESDEIPNEVKAMQDTYHIKEIFKADAEKLLLPMFIKKVPTNRIFDTESGEVKVDKKMLSNGFDLSKEDKTIHFSRTEAEARLVDLDKDNDYIPVARNLKSVQLEALRVYFNQLPTEEKKKQLAKKMAQNIRIDEIAEPHITEYIVDAIAQFDDEALADMMLFEGETTKIIRDKITMLLSAYQEKRFDEMLDTGEIKMGMPYIFPANITYKKKAAGVFKGLYTEEDGEINDFEYKVINAIANLDSVKFWHRNLERAKGFYINGFINHYPDFIVQMNSGMIVVIETKGDDRDNTDSRMKVKLGHKWANKAGDNYRYFMVFDKREMDGAITLPQLIERLSKM